MSLSGQIFSISMTAVFAVGLAACASGVATGSNAAVVTPFYPPSAFEPELEDDVAPLGQAVDDVPASPERIWTLRAALNVAALSCRSAQIVNNYNRMLASQKAVLAEAHAAEAARYRQLHGATGPMRHDRDLTRTYNRFANVGDRAGFCANAEGVLAQVAEVPAPLFSRLARGALLRLDRQAAETVVAAR